MIYIVDLKRETTPELPEKVAKVLSDYIAKHGRPPLMIEVGEGKVEIKEFDLEKTE